MTLKQIAPEKLYYDFEDEVMLDYNYVAITGNHNFTEFGDPIILSIIKGEYYDDDLAEETGNGYEYDIFEELKKYTGYSWTRTTIRGYSQGDLQDVYYVDDSDCEYRTDIEEIENFYMGKVDGFKDEEDCWYYIPHAVCWKGKKAVCEYLGFAEDQTRLYTISGSHVEYEYNEVN